MAAARTREEILSQVNDVAKSGRDNFRVKIELRATAGAHPILVLSVREARAEHVAEPETWLPKLLGGSGDGVFLVSVAHEDAPAMNIGTIEVRIAGRRRDGLDWSVLDDAEYTGPTVIKHPERPAAPATQQIGGNGSGSLLSIAQGAQPAPGVPPVGASVAEGLLLQEQRLATERASLEKARRELDATAMQREQELGARAARAENEVAAARLRAELEASRNETRAAMKELTDRLTQITAPPAVVPVPPMITELIAEVRALSARVNAPMAVVAPPSALEKLLTPETLTGAVTMLLGFFERSSQAAAARQKELTDLQLASMRETREILMKKDADPASLKMIEVMTSMQATNATAMTNQQAQSITMMSNIMDLTLRVSKQLEPPEEPDDGPWLKVGRELLGFLGQRQQQEMALQRYMAGLATGKGAPGAPEAGMGALEAPAPGADGADGAGQDDDSGDLTPDSKSLTDIVRFIQEMRPADEVAKYIFTAFTNDNDFQEEVGSYDGDFAALFADYLGEWLEQDKAKREPYAFALLAKMNEIAAQRMAPSPVPGPRQRRHARQRRQVGGAAATVPAPVVRPVTVVPPAPPPE